MPVITESSVSPIESGSIESTDRRPATLADIGPRTAELTARAERMRRWALDAPGPLAVAYRRRASELELLVAIVTPEWANCAA